MLRILFYEILAAFVEVAGNKSNYVTKSHLCTRHLKDLIILFNLIYNQIRDKVSELTFKSTDYFNCYLFTNT